MAVEPTKSAMAPIRHPACCNFLVIGFSSFISFPSRRSRLDHFLLGSRSTDQHPFHIQCRQHDPERTTAANLRKEFNGAFMGFYSPTGDRKAETRTSCVSRPCHIHAIESIKHLGAMVRGNTWTCVDYVEYALIPFSFGSH